MKKLTIFPILLLFLFGTLKAVTLPSIFSDNMVLQQRASVSIWGWGRPFEKVTVSGSWSDQVVETQVGNQANWMVKLARRKPEAPTP